MSAIQTTSKHQYTLDSNLKTIVLFTRQKFFNSIEILCFHSTPVRCIKQVPPELR
jgi:hypothetical protein